MLNQEAYFKKLLTLHGSKLEMVGELTRILSLSKDAVYRRLRGATALTANEFLELQRHYQVHFGGESNSSLFKFNFAERDIKSPGDYVDQLHERLERVKMLSNVHTLIANPGLPFFHEMIYPRLFAFKLFIYGSTCWNFPGWREMKFSPDVIDHKVLEKARMLGEYSYSVPGRELWTMGILNASLDQIESMHMNGRFANDQQPIDLLDDLKDLVNHLEAMARHGKKFPPGGNPADGAAFFPAQNELANNDNVILIESEQTAILFATFITPNFLQTSDAVVCDLTRDWFNVINELSTPLGAAAGKQRNWYFNRLRRKLESAKERMENKTEIEF